MPQSRTRKSLIDESFDSFFSGGPSGLSIGALGTISGLILASIFLYFRQPVVDAIQAVTGQKLWDPSIRFLTELPSKTDPFEVLAIVVLAIGSAFLFTLYPAWKAASTDPAQAGDSKNLTHI